MPTSLNCDQYYSIHIDSAWALETGKPFIKVGIYDSGLDGLHEDFCPVTPGVQTTKAYGWNFTDHVSLTANNWYLSDNTNVSQPAHIPYSHGTEVTGIIGAIRNNGLGIAGIAGGNWSPTDTGNFGVTLYAMKIDSFNSNVGTPDNYLTLPIADLCDGLTVGCTYTDSGYGYGLHVINNSWGVPYDSVGFNNLVEFRALNDADLRELEQAFKYVYRNKTTIVASAGNSATAIIYPANFYNDWIICVGGTDETGARYVNSSSLGSYQASFVGSSVDIMAPSIAFVSSNSGTFAANTTCYHSYTTGYNTSMAGTSMAAPHATGTVALLMSYLDSSASVYKNLAPEDAEQLLVRNTINAPPGGRQDSVGYGNLNSGRVLQDVNQACKVLKHYGKEDTSLYSIPLVATNVYISLTEPYTNPLNGITYDTLPHLCNVYRASHYNPNNLTSNLSIEAAWTRPSSTTLLLGWDSVTHKLQPFEHLYIDSMSTQTTVVAGYFYILVDSFSNQIGWWGLDSTSDPYRLGYEYTLLLKDNSKNCYPPDTTTGIRKLQNELKATFYPNPVEDAGVLQIFTDANTSATIAIIDQQGRNIETVFDGNLYNGGTNININTKALTSGLYFIVLSTGEGKQTIKFTKL